MIENRLYLSNLELEILKCFNEFKVRYLIIGGRAVQFYGHLRGTKDTDIFVDRSKDNPRKIVNSLITLGFSGDDLDEDNFNKPKQQIPLGRYGTELLTSPIGVSFEDAYINRITTKLKGVSVPIISLENLILQKRSLYRKKDIEDLDVLEKINDFV